MKLSEAILKGCEMVPLETTGELIRKTMDEWATCALGAALVADVGIDEAWEMGRPGSKDRGYRHLRQRFGIPRELEFDIFRENDCGRSRESIAAWLAEQGW